MIQPAPAGIEGMTRGTGVRTPLELALEQLQQGYVEPNREAALTPLDAMRLWAGLFAATFFGIFLCAAIAIVCALLLLVPALPVAEQTLAQFFGLMLLAGVYSLGNILLIQGLPGARLVHSLLFAALLLGPLAVQTQGLQGGLALTGIGAGLAGLLLSNSKRYRAMQELHRLMRQLRRRYRPGRG